nr:hypothetical protein Iba_chr02dCG16930 [Ipomoea batatas]
MAGIYNGMELSPARDRPNKRGVDFIIDDHPLSLEIQGAKRFVIAIDFVPVVVPLLGQFPPLKVYFPEENQNQNCEHENGVWGELESVDQQEPHTFCIIQAPFKLVPRVPVRNFRRSPPSCGRGVDRRGRGRTGAAEQSSGSGEVAAVGRARGSATRVNGAADCAADGPGTRGGAATGCGSGNSQRASSFFSEKYLKKTRFGTQKSRVNY